MVGGQEDMIVDVALDMLKSLKDFDLKLQCSCRISERAQPNAKPEAITPLKKLITMLQLRRR